MSSAQNINPVRSLTKRVVLISLGVALIMAAVVMLIDKAVNAVSVVIGALVAIASFLVLVWMVTKAVSPSRWPKALVAGIGFLKLGVLGAILWWLVSNKLIEPITFLAGFSSVVVALVIEGIRLRRTTDKV